MSCLAAEAKWDTTPLLHLPSLPVLPPLLLRLPLLSVPPPQTALCQESAGRQTYAGEWYGEEIARVAACS